MYVRSQTKRSAPSARSATAGLGPVSPASAIALLAGPEGTVVGLLRTTAPFAGATVA